MKISFDFDPITQEVTNLKVEGLPKVQPTTVTQASKVELHNTSLKLNQDVLDQLELKVGDRVSVNFTEDGPVLVNPKQAGMEKGGNLITKSMTVSCKGKTSELLAKYGKEFDYKLDSKGWMTLQPYTLEVKTDTVEEQPDTQIDLLDDSVFTDSIEDGKEIHLEM